MAAGQSEEHGRPEWPSGRYFTAAHSVLGPVSSRLLGRLAGRVGNAACGVLDMAQGFAGCFGAVPVELSSPHSKKREPGVRWCARNHQPAYFLSLIVIVITLAQLGVQTAILTVILAVILISVSGLLYFGYGAGAGLRQPRSGREHPAGRRLRARALSAAQWSRPPD